MNMNHVPHKDTAHRACNSAFGNAVQQFKEFVGKKSFSLVAAVGADHARARTSNLRGIVDDVQSYHRYMFGKHIISD